MNGIIGGGVTVNINISVVVMPGSCQQCQKLQANILKCFPITEKMSSTL